MKNSVMKGLALAATLVAVPAHADDWTGFHIGVGLGGAHGSTDLSADADVNGLGELSTYNVGEVGEVATGEQYYFAGNAAAAANTGKTSFFGTVEGGFDYQVGDSFVIGAFGNYDFASKQDQGISGGGAWEFGYQEGPLNNAGAIDLSSDDYDAYRYDNGAAEINAAARIKDSWALGARAGWLANPSTLIYVAGGYTEAKISLDGSAELIESNVASYGPADESILTGGELTGSVTGSTWKDGYFLGGGVETLLGSNVSAKVEYRYADHGSYSVSREDTFSIEDVEGTVTGNVSASKLRNQSVRLVLSYRM